MEDLGSCCCGPHSRRVRDSSHCVTFTRIALGQREGAFITAKVSQVLLEEKSLRQEEKFTF